MAPRAKKKTTTPRPRRKAEEGPRPVRGLAVGNVIPGWKVFRLDLEAKDLTPERKALAKRYNAVTVDVRRLARDQVSRFRQEVSLASSLWDDVDQEAKTPEDRRKAVEAAAGVERAVLDVYRELLLTEAKKGGKEFGTCLVCVRPIDLVQDDDSVVRLEDLTPAEQVDWLEELGLLDAVGQAALQAQSTEAQNLHL